MEDVPTEYRMGLEKLKNRKKKGLYIGLSLIIVGFIFLIFVLTIIQPNDLILLGVFIGFFAMVITGVIYFMVVGDSSRNLLNCLEAIMPLEPERLVITERFVMALKDGIYLIVKWSNTMLVLIKFKELREIPEGIGVRMRLSTPKTIFGKTKRIGDRNVFFKRGRFIIPIDHKRFAEGEGMAYYIQLERDLILGPVSIRLDNTPGADILKRIIEALKNEPLY